MEFTFWWEKQTINQIIKQTDIIMLVTSVSKMRNRLGKVGEIRQPEKGTARRWSLNKYLRVKDRCVDNRERMPVESRARGGVNLAPLRDHLATVAGKEPTGSVWQRELRDGPEPNPVGPVDHGQDWILFQVCQGNHWRVLKMEGTFPTISSTASLGQGHQ